MNKSPYIDVRTIPVLVLILSLAVILALGGCANNPTTPNLYVPNPSTAPAPTVTSITPPGGGLSGVTVLTITGTNFSPDPAKDLVFFDNKLATVSQATTTQLTLVAPNYAKDSASVQVAVYRAAQYSAPVYYSLTSPVSNFGNLGVTDVPWGIATDAQGNLYVSFQSDSIYKFTPSGTKSGFAKTGTITKWTALKMGPGGVLFGTRTLPAIYQIPAGSSTVTPWVAFGNLGTVYDIDFDQNGNIWACGSNSSVYRIRTSDQDVKAFPCDGNLRSVRVYNGYVYFGGTMNSDGLDRVVRFKIITPDSLGPQETYFEYSSASMYATGTSIYAITFSSTGEMFVATDLPDPILLVPVGGSAGATQTFFPGILSPTLHLFAWGSGSSLYAVKGTASGGVITASKSIQKITTQKASAPYYGQ